MQTLNKAMKIQVINHYSLKAKVVKDRRSISGLTSKMNQHFLKINVITKKYKKQIIIYKMMLLINTIKMIHKVMQKCKVKGFIKEASIMQVLVVIL